MAKQKIAVDVRIVLQLLIGILFICMGIVGFSYSKGLGAELTREISRQFGSDRELLSYLISTVELVCGLFLVLALGVKAIPARFTKIAMVVVWILWIAIIVVLDVFAVSFDRLSGLDWILWAQELSLHLIVLIGIIIVSGRKPA